MSKTSFSTLALTIAALVLAPLLRADVVVTKDGSRIVGHLTGINAGAVKIVTSYAGEITIKQSEVVAISTEKPISVRLDTGTRIDGTIVTRNGSVQISSTDGRVATTVPKVTQSWPVGGLDPADAHWVYEATVDINGTTGNKDQLGTSAGFSAKRIGPQDELDFYTNYNRQVTEGETSADQFKAGVDYTDNFTSTSSWFIRDEAGFDRVMGIRFYETAAVGMGEALFKNDVDVLTGRVGIAYRYDGYEDPATSAVNSAAADFELDHDLKTAEWELVDKIVIIPAFSNFNNVAMTQDSYFQVPLKNPAWKLRLGLANSYESQPPPGIKKLDTTYYTRLILDWGQ